MAEQKSEIDVSQVVENPKPATPATLEDAVVMPAMEVEEDIVLTTIKDEEPADQVLKALMYGFAEEQTSLRTLRKEKQGEGKDTSHISLKRGTLLKYMSETLLQKQALSGNTDDLNLRGPKFREVFKMFLETISDTFDEVKLPPEYKDIFFRTLSEKLNGWEARAEKVIKTMNNPK